MKITITAPTLAEAQDTAPRIVNALTDQSLSSIEARKDAGHSVVTLTFGEADDA